MWTPWWYSFCLSPQLLLSLYKKTHSLAAAKLDSPSMALRVSARCLECPSLHICSPSPTSHSSKLSRMTHRVWNLSPSLSSLGSHLAHTSTGELKLTALPLGTCSYILRNGVCDFITHPYKHSAPVWEMTLITEITQLTFIKDLSCARIQDILGHFIYTTYGG